jgi:SAM-dependent methyltransferase
MNYWTTEELRTLRRLREGFIQGTAGQADYWRSDEELRLYDSTFAVRIGWKWDAVLGELQLRGWRPEASRIVDLGCGTGIASRRVLEHWPDQFRSVTLMDRSASARAYAANRVREVAPQCEIRVQAPKDVDCSGALVLASHVITELNDEHLATWLKLLKTASAVIWVESATHEASRNLIAALREPLLKSGGWNTVAPCTHQGACPLLSDENARHWCHHFARVPTEAHQNGAHAAFSEEIGVDRRVLPYSFLVMEQGKADTQLPGGSRVIGRANEFKGYSKVLSCSATGLHDWMLQKRDLPEIFKALRKEDGVALYKWQTEGGRIVAGERLLSGVHEEE